MRPNCIAPPVRDLLPEFWSMRNVKNLVTLICRKGEQIDIWFDSTIKRRRSARSFRIQRTERDLNSRKAVTSVDYVIPKKSIDLSER